MEIGGKSKGKVGENNSRRSGIDMLSEPARDQAPEEGDRDGGEETDKETEDRDGDPDCNRHVRHVQLHGLCSPGSAWVWLCDSGNRNLTTNPEKRMKMEEMILVSN